MTRQIRCGWGILCMAAMLFASGCSVYVQQPYQEAPAASASADDADVDAGYQPPPAEVITVYQTDLNPYGHWVSDPTYGQCWEPNNCPPGWQPYTVGHWVNSDDGWTWVSDGDEVDWGPVVYHYGCWYQNSGNWCWVPGTTWAPAWVAWREGGGYCGWAPLPPQCAFSSNISPALVDRYCPANQFTYCNEQYITDSRVDQHITRNNLTIINQTKNITNINVSNNHVINRGVAVANVEHATGKPVQTIALSTVTSADQARQMVKSGKPVMYVPPAVKTAQAQRPAPQRQAQPQNNAQRNPEPTVQNRPDNTAQAPRENPAQTNAPNPRVEEQNGQARTPPSPGPQAQQRKAAPTDNEQPHESEPSVPQRQQPAAPNRPDEQQNNSRNTKAPPPDNAQPHESEPSVQEKQKPAESQNRPAPQKPAEQNRSQDNNSHDTKAPPQNKAQDKNPPEQGKPAGDNQKKPDNGK